MPVCSILASEDLGNDLEDLSTSSRCSGFFYGRKRGLRGTIADDCFEQGQEDEAMMFEIKE